MTDAGYSSKYEVYLTHRNGIQIVTNELSLRILAEMRRREVSPSETALLFQLPKSTIQGNITKLLRAGIVKQETCIDDARSAVYHIDAMLIFSSAVDEDWQKYARSASVARIMRNGRCTSREDLSLYAVSLMESGFNIVQGLFNVGEALTRGMEDPDWWDGMVATMGEQCSRDGVRIELDTEDALKLSFRSDGEDISDIPLIIVPMLGALRSRAGVMFGYELSHDIQLSIGDAGCSVDLRINPFRGQDFADERHSDPLESFSIESPFSIYSIKGKAMMFTNPTMMGVLDALSTGDRSLNELEEAMGVPKATIYASAAKLMELGAVRVDPDSGTPKKYNLLADPILFITEPDLRNGDRLASIVADFQRGTLDYYSAVIAYSLEVIGRMGIHFDKMFMRAGMNTALIALGLKSSIQPQELVDLACDMVSGPDRAEVASYLPIRIRIRLSDQTLWDAWPADFVLGFITEGLKYLLEHRYPVIVETYRGDSDVPSLVQKS